MNSKIAAFSFSLLFLVHVPPVRAEMTEPTPYRVCDVICKDYHCEGQIFRACANENATGDLSADMLAIHGFQNLTKDFPLEPIAIMKCEFKTIAQALVTPECADPKFFGKAPLKKL